MHHFRCVNCGRESYSASREPLEACEFCGGRLVVDPPEPAPADEEPADDD